MFETGWKPAPLEIPLPPGTKVRKGWKCGSLIANPPPPPPPSSRTFEQLVEMARKSDHGELREVDVYDWGAVCWIKEI